MSQKANYFKIGLFFIISVILIVIAVIIWGAGLFTTDKVYFETYFDSSVAGLNPGASIAFRGVKIGNVESIQFVDAVYDLSTDSATVSKYELYVRVMCSLDKEESQEQVGDGTEEQREARIRNMIEQGLRLRLASNILTGQAYLEGVFLDPERFPLLDTIWEPKYLYVPSAPGTFATMKDSVDKILVKLEEIDIKAITDNISGVLVELMHLLKSSDPDAESVNLPQVMGRLDSILRRIDKQTANRSSDIDRFLRNMGAISDDIKELTARLKEDPSEIIFSQPPKKSEMIK